jgi:hypothetical protein
MSVRKRLESSREERAKARAKRREEARRAARAKEIAKEGRAAKKPPQTDDPQPPEAPKRERPVGRRRALKGRGEKRKATPALAAKDRRRTVSADARKLGSGAASAGTELLKLGREMVAIPVGLWLAAAEFVGAFVLKGWLRVLRPALLALWRLAVAVLHFAERQVTPARAVVVVAVVACGALAASQWLDYHAVSVGIDAYAGEVGAIAPPPEVESEIAGNAHAWVMVPLAALGLVAVGLAIFGRRRAALLLVPIGLAAIAIALIVDVPKGLDEGTAELAYEDASASLLEGFWLQLAAATVIIACGFLLPRYLRPQTAAESAPLTGPSLFDRGAGGARKLAKRRPSLPKPKLTLPKRPRPKRKVEGART